MGRNKHGHRWHPWRYLAHRHPHLRVTCEYVLPESRKGLATTEGIYLDRRLTQAGRRCTLTHEIIHLERGAPPDHPHFAAYEEHLVEVLAARRLIAIPQLIDAALWTQHPYELADELWVDIDTLTTRVQHLTREERATIIRELAERQPWNN
ncbi:hypothetical protein [Rhodococcus rhodochrous]|uniref:hypothetical protein n=1 Tax=Rhodococcus rhodochrous TaxID=1829 RepID=UPI001E5307C3|nr:hypothetical protein [Rhodococcus rhodochrous]MCD2096576.1 hypothetical protein [Rhodococcus rhodochrous]MCD2121206.1 hypothetical protein [Rhodococcus rhodochrous]MCQ4137299.1 hypothetical protein [Rhodococcus rhodochrous]MDJ0021208.1 hypothetical protein [Rhodococcus rhodochrous]